MPTFVPFVFFVIPELYGSRCWQTMQEIVIVFRQVSDATFIEHRRQKLVCTAANIRAQLPHGDFPCGCLRQRSALQSLHSASILHFTLVCQLLSTSCRLWYQKRMGYAVGRPCKKFWLSSDSLPFSLVTHCSQKIVFVAAIVLAQFVNPTFCESR